MRTISLATSSAFIGLTARPDSPLRARCLDRRVGWVRVAWFAGIAQGWKVTDPQVLADVGPVPDHETLIEIPEEVLTFYARRYQQETEGDS